MSHGLDINKKDSQVVRIPFLDETDLRPGQEGLYTKDRFFLNGYFEPIKSPLTQEVELHFTKRPGISRRTQISSSPGNGRVVTRRKGTSAIYSAIANQLYSDTTNLGVLLNNSTGKLGVAETRPGATTQYLGFNDGVALFLVAADNSVIVMNNTIVATSSAANPTTITTTGFHNLASGNKVIIRNHSLAGVNDTIFTVTVTSGTTFTIPVLGGGVGGTIGVFPANTGDLVYMDGYWFTIDNKNQIWNCKVDDPTTWATIDFITALMLPGIGTSLAKQNNYLVAFSDRHFQLFANNANPVGSPLINVEQGMQQIGCFDTNSVAFTENTVYWISNTNTGSFSVYRLDGTSNLRDIGTPTLGRAIAAAVAASGYATVGFILRHTGHVFYVLHIKSFTTPNVTFIYDQNLDIWFNWSDVSGSSVWTINSIAQGISPTAGVIGLHASDGFLYNIDMAIFQDNGSNFPVVMQTNPLTFGTMARKFYDRAELIGDRQTTTANALLSFSDNDFVTFGATRTLDMSQIRMFTRNLSNSRRRSWKVSYSGNTPLRLQALEFTIELDVS